MKVFLVYAHPEQRSLNGALRDVAVDELEVLGHEVRVSDLYAVGWKSEVDRADFPHLDQEARLRVAAASSEAFGGDVLTQDVKDEQQKLLWADAVILQFPLWWFSMPAILKGWVDQVYAYGFGYGVGEHSEKRWGDRYGEGRLAGKRADADRDRRRLGGTLFRPRRQWTDRRSAVPDQSRHPLLPRLRRCPSLRRLSRGSHERGRIRGDIDPARGADANPRAPLPRSRIGGKTAATM